MTNYWQLIKNDNTDNNRNDDNSNDGAFDDSRDNRDI